jgi:hypothetical protein
MQNSLQDCKANKYHHYFGVNHRLVTIILIVTVNKAWSDRTQFPNIGFKKYTTVTIHLNKKLKLDTIYQHWVRNQNSHNLPHCVQELENNDCDSSFNQI